jgi:GNAT superfamily N-acetyltransferase
MLYTGRWSDAIVRLDARTRPLFELSLERSRDWGLADERIPELPACDGRDDAGAVGIRYADALAAQAIYRYVRRVDGGALRARVMLLAIGVAPEHRRSGMATALVQRCMAIAREAGVTNLVFDDVAADAASRAFAARYSADLTFCDGGCQAWIELTPPAVSPISKARVTACNG